MILPLLALEFLFIGLFSVGGGMAIVPFLHSLGLRSAWFTLEELSSIVAISELTPGPIGVNMSTYVGYLTAGVPGAILAPLALSFPAFVIILLVSKFMNRWHDNPTVRGVFYGLRPASAGLIAAVLLSVSLHTFFPEAAFLNWKALLLFALLLPCFFLPKLKKIPLPVFFLLSAAAGIAFQLGGA